MILFLTTADTEILATARARDLLPKGFPQIGAANPSRIEDPHIFLENALPEARVVLVRLLGGRGAWSEGFDRLSAACVERDIPLLAFGGETAVDADLTSASTAPAGTVAEAFEYLRHSGIGNMANLFRFVADTVLLEGYGFDPPEAVPEVGLYHPETLRKSDPNRPTVAIVFYRTHLLSGNTDFVDTLIDAVTEAGADPMAVFCYSLRPDGSGRIAAVDLIRGRADALIVTVLASGGSCPTDGRSSDTEWVSWEVPALEELGVPIVQGLCVTSPRSKWESGDSGLSPVDAAMQVAIPEFDGRVITVPVSFKEPVSEGSRVLAYRADNERAARVAGIASRLARLGAADNRDKRIALVLSSYPTRHSRVGNAVALDTPASAVVLLRALAAAGFHVGEVPDDGDELIHRLIASGGYDEEFLTEEQLRAAEARLDIDLYARWFQELPDDLRAEVIGQWGEPPGSLYVSDDSLVLAGVRYGNVFLCIQPPRGFSEDPIAIYHHPDLPPSHHYLAGYWWLDRIFGADAIVHLGKHGTLEWLPGKSLALSQSCAPDAVLGDVPLFYPFVVNDPGEGTQAKRRAHAVIIDHLIPPMMRAEVYDDLARLEGLLDEFAQVQSLDPKKLPELRSRIWELVRSAELHRDLGVDSQPEDFDGFISHIDGYLCEIKDLQIRDGLHILGQTPLGEQRQGLIAAMLRLPMGAAPALRAAVAESFGLDERAMLDDPGRVVTVANDLVHRFPGPHHTGADCIDRLEEAVRALLAALDDKGWDHACVPSVLEEVLGRDDPAVTAALSFACRELVPRLERTADELRNLVRGLEGGFVPSGPSGSPTRGLPNVLPTGRNFYSVDPKALPSDLAWATGCRLADDLLARFLSEEGHYPETVGMVVWGTSAMRTQGDDIAEILALIGVRPVHDERSRRVTGIEVIPLSELGRPRIDVTVRISGFFRDAFPNLIALLDEGFRSVAALDEADEVNFVAKHVRSRLAEGATERSATTRIFGSKPGAYGAGLLPLIDARNWKTDADLARVYEVWGGYAYGDGLDGVAAIDDLRSGLARVEVAVKNVDTREHDIFDSDDYFQYHGGMVATVRALTGRDPRAFIGDSADPVNVKNRDLIEEARRVFRARVANPRWIASMRRHGYKGAFELSATVDYMFGYDATAGVVEDWMYERIAEAYVSDEVTASFMRTSNPWALRAIAERLLEAADRGLWAQPPEDILKELRTTFLALDGDLEEVRP